MALLAWGGVFVPVLAGVAVGSEEGGEEETEDCYFDFVHRFILKNADYNKENNETRLKIHW